MMSNMHEPTLSNILWIATHISAVVGNPVSCTMEVSDVEKNGLYGVWSSEGTDYYRVRLCCYKGKLLVFIEDDNVSDAHWNKMLNVIGYCAFHNVPFVATQWPGIDKLDEVVGR